MSAKPCGGSSAEEDSTSRTYQKRDAEGSHARGLMEDQEQPKTVRHGIPDYAGTSLESTISSAERVFLIHNELERTEDN